MFICRYSNGSIRFEEIMHWDFQKINAVMNSLNYLLKMEYNVKEEKPLTGKAAAEFMVKMFPKNIKNKKA